MPKFPFPEKIDNTALAEFQDCRKFFYWDMVRRIRPKGSNIHLDFGGAFARGLERMRRAFYEEGKSQEECEYLGLETAFEAFKDVEVPEEEASKTAHGLIRALEVYTDTWPFETDALQPARFESGKYGIEFSFAIPMEVKHPETGNPIILCRSEERR